MFTTTYVTEQEAMTYLGVDHQELSHLLDQGTIKYYKVGQVRCLLSSDIFTYEIKQEMLAELLKASQDKEMGYE